MISRISAGPRSGATIQRIKIRRAICGLREHPLHRQLRTTRPARITNKVLLTSPNIMMSIGLVFWILYLIALVFGAWWNWPAGGNFRPFGGTLLVFVLIGLIGWKLFGAPIHG